MCYLVHLQTIYNGYGLEFINTYMRVIFFTFPRRFHEGRYYSPYYSCGNGF